ncbi:MAG: helix-turn-helix domain-containing protein [Clostridia bacterium]|nr:helix-turn-helix domain-containing protein [Clostridia bacterium]
MKKISNDRKIYNGENYPKKRTKKVIEVEEILFNGEVLYCISNKLKEYRSKYNMTQQDLADKIGVNRVMISKLEKGDYNPSFKELVKISYKLTNSSDLFFDIITNIVMELSNDYGYYYDAMLQNEEEPILKLAEPKNESQVYKK